CWGNKADGQATPLAGTFTQVSAGGAYTCGVRTNGTPACWGDNSDGRATPPSVVASPTTIARGGSTTASWAGLATPTAKDWIGLYHHTAADTAFVAFIYTTGAASGSKSFPVPFSVPPGTDYELRLFSNDGFNRLATSGLIRVTDPATVSASPTS